MPQKSASRRSMIERAMITQLFLKRYPRRNVVFRIIIWSRSADCRSQERQGLGCTPLPEKQRRLALSPVLAALHRLIALSLADIIKAFRIHQNRGVCFATIFDSDRAARAPLASPFSVTSWKRTCTASRPAGFRESNVLMPIFRSDPDFFKGLTASSSGSSDLDEEEGNPEQSE